MIVVIADDFTGAAEIGGVALRYGLAAEVQTEFNAYADVDLIVVDADTRSCTAEEAAQRVASLAKLFRQDAIEHVFKKVDSVLRGQVIAELTALLGVWGKPRTLLVPANPGLGRVISGGHYFINGQPLHETDFSRDPEYPATTSDVLAILGPSGDWSVRVLQSGEALPDRGIFVGEVGREADVAAWARKLDDTTLPAGAAEFFGSFLTAMGFGLVERAPAEVGSMEYANALFVCGSTSAYSRSFRQQCEAHGIPVLRMPSGLFGITPQSPDLIREWADATVKALKAHPRVMVAVDQPLRRDPDLPQILSGHLGELVAQVMDRQRVHHLFAEGGATAVALVRQFGWKRLQVRRELAPGVVCMQIEGQMRPLLTMKPGSYAWPDEVWKVEIPKEIN